MSNIAKIPKLQLAFDCRYRKSGIEKFLIRAIYDVFIAPVYAAAATITVVFLQLLLVFCTAALAHFLADFYYSDLVKKEKFCICRILILYLSLACLSNLPLHRFCSIKPPPPPKSSFGIAFEFPTTKHSIFAGSSPVRMDGGRCVDFSVNFVRFSQEHGLAEVGLSGGPSVGHIRPDLPAIRDSQLFLFEPGLWLRRRLRGSLILDNVRLRCRWRKTDVVY